MCEWWWVARAAASGTDTEARLQLWKDPPVAPRPPSASSWFVLGDASTSSVPGADLVVSPTAWGIFLVFVAVVLLLDLFVFHRDDHEISVREAAVSSAGWIALGLAFGVVVWVWLGSSAAGQYYAGYLIEKSLSVDNVFVWAVILGFFAVPREFQHRVLYWGIFGALFLRAIFVFAGIALLERLSWLTFVFGAFLVFTGFRVARDHGEEVHPERNPVLRFMRNHIPITPDYRGHHFFVKEQGKRWATPMFAVLVMIELTDVVFAVDSIPAILAVSRSTFIVFSSNVFAILGLRSLFFVLAGFQDRLVHLNKGLGVVLGFVGVKMLIERWYHIPTVVSLGVIAFILTVTVVLSLRADPEPLDLPVDHSLEPSPEGELD
jgi:tellurite resistance protein TerC